MREKSKSITRRPRVGTPLYHCVTDLAQYTFALPWVPRAAVADRALILASLAATAPLKLPFSFIRDWVIIPRFIKAGVKIPRASAKSDALLDDNAHWWREERARKEWRPAGPNPLVLLTISAAHLREKSAATGLGVTECRARVAASLKITERQVEYGLQLCRARREASDEIFSLVTEDVLLRLAELLRAFDERRKAEAQRLKRADRHYQPANFGAVVAAAVTLPNLESE